MSGHRNSLSPGYKLHWYLIREILGQGGFGITYLAEDTNLNQLVAIKEFLPVEMAVRENDASVHPVSGEHGEQFRWGLDRFMSEAQTLAQFKHPNIVRVLTVFPENNTAYMVMEYEQGMGLHELLKQRKTIPEAELKTIILPIMDGLEQVHQAGFIHRDIKPPNIYIREDGSPVLLDFGSARQSFGEHTRTLTTMISPGYAPFEQYVGKSDKQGPWTDIYGIAATLYRSVTGLSPVDAMDRSESIINTSRDVYVLATEIRPEGYSLSFLSAIDKAMSFKPEERPQSISDWRQLIDNTPASVNESEARTEVINQEDDNTADITPSTVKISITPDQNIAAEENNVVEDKKPVKWKIIIWLLPALIVLFILSSLLKDREQVPDGTVKTPVTGSVEQPAPQKDWPAPAADIPGSDSDMTDKMDTARDKTREVVTGAVSDSQQPRLIDDSDKRQLALIKQRLGENPDDKRARRQLRTLTKKYEAKVKQALEDKDYQLARTYLKQMLEISPDNRKLQEALQRISNLENQGR